MGDIMPQLDNLTYLPQVFWVAVVFSLWYAISSIDDLVYWNITHEQEMTIILIMFFACIVYVLSAPVDVPFLPCDRAGRRGQSYAGRQDGSAYSESVLAALKNLRESPGVIFKLSRTV